MYFVLAIAVMLSTYALEWAASKADKKEFSWEMWLFAYLMALIVIVELRR